LNQFLWTVAETIHLTAGYGDVVVNLYRPAWDDYETVVVVGPDEAAQALIGRTAPGSSFDMIRATEPELLPGVFLVPADSSAWAHFENVFTPELPPCDDPGAWQAEDGLFVFLNDSARRPLAFLSLDRPAAGRRPSARDLQVVRALCDHVEHALEIARRAEQAAENQRILALLLEASPALSACTTTVELMAMAGATVVPDLGFERFAGYRLDRGRLKRCARIGWDGQPQQPARTLDPERVTMLLSDERRHAGCYLLKADQLFDAPAVTGVQRSARNGRGPLAWNDHCLVAPLVDGPERLAGLIVIEDPGDRLLPSDDQRRAVRLLADQIAAGQVSIEQRARLNHLATHDALTGVRNRRGLAEAITGRRNVALLVCDLDHFKRVNDHFGHDLGDRVLIRFGELLRDLARDTDIPMRLGGEEFCVVLPNTSRTGALRAAERLRRETARELRALVPGGITVSIGVAISSDGPANERALLAAADRGLYAAKAAGRDRTVLVDSPSLAADAGRVGSSV
jgi:diguanylate cyclase (GGDEF)-like protein